MRSKLFTIHNLRRLIKSPILIAFLLNPINDVWRKTALRLQARLYGGQIVFGSDVHVSHPTVFQGRGRLVIKRGVRLGYPLAGALGNPILLQPREAGAEILLDENCAVMNGCELIARIAITIGKNTLVGPSTTIMDSDFHGIEPSQRRQPGISIPVVIGENVWIGAKVTILKGVQIGKDAIIGAGSVVSRDIPAGVIAAGNPVQILKSIYPAEQDLV